jgi:signal transduction histidine kinase
VLLIGLIACIVLATALVRPLERLTMIARDIARGAKPPRIAALAGGREVVELTGALGMMLERLNEANHQLVEASRRAGMAEVATGVLHNVGNILTSVNVGIAALDERIGDIPADRLRRAGELLAAASAASADEPARLDAGIRYITAIADHLTGDRAALVADLGTLRDHIEHVSRVITMQNSYARTGGVNEPVELATLVDEAIGLACPDAGQHGLEVVRDVEAGRVVAIDRHRVLQILVNLVANARDSLVELRRAGAPGRSRIAVAAVLEPDWVELRVEDTGNGIAPELALRIFNAGFTTKAKGHGYGLHSSALAAEQLGGTLRCTSDGIGRGATFMLRVPIDTERFHAE